MQKLHPPVVQWVGVTMVLDNRKWLRTYNMFRRVMYLFNMIQNPVSCRIHLIRSALSSISSNVWSFSTIYWNYCCICTCLIRRICNLVTVFCCCCRVCVRILWYSWLHYEVIFTLVILLIWHEFSIFHCQYIALYNFSCRFRKLEAQLVDLSALSCVFVWGCVIIFPSISGSLLPAVHSFRGMTWVSH